MDEKDDRNAEAQDYITERKNIRRIERISRKEHNFMSNLEQDLLSKLPSALVPGNVGNYYDVAWPFDYTVSFNFGDNPSYGPSYPNPQILNSAANLGGGLQSFQVSQEAAFIIGSISRKCYSGSTSGELAPLQIIVRDRQSTRQFMDLPIPLQAIAKKTPSTHWEIPLILMPNAFLDVSISSWLPSSQGSIGSGRMNITFSGYRTRTSDIGKVLSTVFGG